jgi:SAM-dependent methyltransferase
VDQHAWDDRYRAKDLVWGSGPNAFLVEAVGGLSPGKALDLACGQGRNAVWLATKGWEVTAVDWSEVGLAGARSLAAEAGVEVDWQLADLLTWSCEPAAYDLVIVVYLQIPQAERHAVWRAAVDAVGPEGRLMIIGHDLANLTEGYGGPQDPGVLYTASEVVGVIGSRLRVERAERLQRVVETDDGVRAEAVDNIVVASGATLRSGSLPRSP